MTAIAFLCALLILVLNGHDKAAGLLLVGFVVLIMVLGHIRDRDARKWGMQ